MNSDLAGLSLGEFREDTFAQLEKTLQQNGGLSTRACLLVWATKAEANALAREASLLRGRLPARPLDGRSFADKEM